MHRAAAAVRACLCEQVPQELRELRRLAWFSMAGNPACALPRPPVPVPALDMSHLQVGPALGDGASGDVFAACWEGRAVAVKVFHADVSPDGCAADEINVAACLEHPNLIR